MTQEEKQLLLQDLCGRLPYGVKATTKSAVWNECYKIEGYKNHRFYLECPVYGEGDDEWMIESIIPFLRPISSMTEEEREEYRKFSYYGAIGIRNEDFTDTIAVPSFEKIDYLNSHHFDYKGLIEKGLAMEAPEDMYSTKTE